MEKLLLSSALACAQLELSYLLGRKTPLFIGVKRTLEFPC